MLRFIQYALVSVLIVLTAVTINAVTASFNIRPLKFLAPTTKIVAQVSTGVKQSIQETKAFIFPSAVDSSFLNSALDSRLNVEDRVSSVLALAELPLEESFETLIEIATAPIRMSIGNKRVYREEFAVRAAALEAFIKLDDSELALESLQEIYKKLDDRLLRERLMLVKNAIILKDSEYVSKQDQIYFNKLAAQRDSRLSE